MGKSKKCFYIENMLSFLRHWLLSIAKDRFSLSVCLFSVSEFSRWIPCCCRCHFEFDAPTRVWTTTRRRASWAELENETGKWCFTIFHFSIRAHYFRLIILCSKEAVPFQTLQCAVIPTSELIAVVIVTNIDMVVVRLTTTTTTRNKKETKTHCLLFESAAIFLYQPPFIRSFLFFLTTPFFLPSRSNSVDTIAFHKTVHQRSAIEPVIDFILLRFSLLNGLVSSLGGKSCNIE